MCEVYGHSHGHLVLMFAGVSCVNCYSSAVNVQLPDDGALALQLRLPLFSGPGDLAEAQQADQDVLTGVLVRQKGLPAIVGGVVPPYQLYLFRLDLSEEA